MLVYSLSENIWATSSKLKCRLLSSAQHALCEKKITFHKRERERENFNGNKTKERKEKQKRMREKCL